jgi:hypothetical protein
MERWAAVNVKSASLLGEAVAGGMRRTRLPNLNVS